MKNQILPVLMMGMLLGCQGAEEFYGAAERAITAENSTFMAMQYTNRIQKRGPVVAEQLENWSNRHLVLSQKLQKLVTHMETKPADRLVVNLDEAQIKLDHIFERHVEFNLLMPEWEKRQASVSINRLREARENLLASYESLYGELPKHVGRFEVKFKIDSGLRDTQHECISAFEPVSRFDQECYRIAKSKCGHQMDMTCVNHAIKLNVKKFGQLNLCHDMILQEDVFDDSGKSYVRENREWIWDVFRHCVSEELVTK